MEVHPYIIPCSARKNCNSARQDIPELQGDSEHPGDEVHQNKTEGIHDDELHPLFCMRTISILKRPILIHEEHVHEDNERHERTGDGNRERENFDAKREEEKIEAGIHNSGDEELSDLQRMAMEIGGTDEERGKEALDDFVDAKV